MSRELTGSRFDFARPHSGAIASQCARVCSAGGVRSRSRSQKD